MNQQLFETLKPVLADRLNVLISEITPDKTLKDLGADSLDGVETIMSLEAHFNIAIPDSDMEKFTTIESIVNYIDEHTKK